MIRVNLSAYEGLPPELSSDSRKISVSAPLYSKDAVLDLLATAKEGLQKEHEAPLIRYFTDRCKRDVANLSWDMENLINFLLEAVPHARYIDSEWCDASNKGHIAACDSYQYIKKQVWQEKMRTFMDEDTYFKFAISKTGLLLLLVSCHPSGAL